MKLSSLFICGLLDLDRYVTELAPTHVLSLLTAAHMPETPFSVEPENHLKVVCHDIVEPFPEAIAPDEQHVSAIVEFARHWDASTPMLVHCFAGVSRSTAAALVVATVHHDGDEELLAQRLRRAAPHAHPNERIIELADRLLQRQGRLVRAVENMGYGTLVDKAPLVELTLGVEPAGNSLNRAYAPDS